MNYEETFDKSYKRVMSASKHSASFFDTFYDKFIDSSPIVAQHFRNTNMEKQKTMLKKSFYRLFAFYATNNSDDYIEKIADRHSKKELNIELDLYDLWLENLIDTVKDYDPEFNKEVELAWRLVLSAGITYMKFRHSSK
ncbi:MAG: globin [Gammaproteobacteria bacterium]|nr:globin [Gammaproteobacteria bacterium]